VAAGEETDVAFISGVKRMSILWVLVGVLLGGQWAVQGQPLPQSIRISYSNGGGRFVATNLALKFGFSTPGPNGEAGEPEPATLIFENRRFATNDVGRLILADVVTDPHFSAFATRLTNGVAEFIHHNAFSQSDIAVMEAVFFALASGPDLRGYPVHTVGLRFDQIDVRTPGSDPNGDGLWTDYSYSAVLLVNPPLKLNVTPARTNVVLSWTREAAHYRLESTTQFPPAPGGWAEVTLPRVFTNDLLRVVMPATGSRRLLRLAR
jgi:hypothetical protein